MFLHGSLTGPNLFSGPLSLLEKKGLSAAALKIEYPKCLNENLSRPQLQHLESECIKSLEEVNASEKLTIVRYLCDLWLYIIFDKVFIVFMIRLCVIFSRLDMAVVQFLPSGLLIVSRQR